MESLRAMHFMVVWLPWKFLNKGGWLSPFLAVAFNFVSYIVLGLRANCFSILNYILGCHLDSDFHSKPKHTHPCLMIHYFWYCFRFDWIDWKDTISNLNG